MGGLRTGAAVLVAVAALCVAAPGAAQVEPAPVKPDLKGTVGLGLIGAELGFVVPALAGLDQTWAFIVFPVLGAGGGAVAGHFLVDEGVDSPELSVATLTLGMAMIIPAMIITLSATAYDPDDELIDARAPPPALLQLSERGVGLAPPPVGYAASTRAVQVSLVSGRL